MTMTNNQALELCLALMRADTEEAVIDLIKSARLWDEGAAWRFFGDQENNFSTIGNQQSRSDAALIEKLVNSVDARLMNECLVRRVGTESARAPKSIRDAVAEFFEDPHRAKSDTAGRISHWSDSKRTEVARGITLSATGFTPRE